jgi:hypothetical protein
MIDKTETLYISGPMTGIADSNRPAFHAMEKILTETFGCKVLNPARITDEHVQEHHAGLETEALYRVYMQHDIDLIFSASGIVLLSGHKDSRGASAELALAKCLNLRIFHDWEILEHAGKPVAI